MISSLSRRRPSLHALSPRGPVGCQALDLAGGQFKFGEAEVVRRCGDPGKEAVAARLGGRLALRVNFGFRPKAGPQPARHEPLLMPHTCIRNTRRDRLSWADSGPSPIRASTSR
jgi:hypothetical protein